MADGGLGGVQMVLLITKWTKYVRSRTVKGDIEIFNLDAPRNYSNLTGQPIRYVKAVILWCRCMAE
jgi:hypothetical protein